MANTIKVGKGSSKYEVIISKNALTKFNLAPQIKSSKNILIVTDSGIPKKYIKELRTKIGHNKNITRARKDFINNYTDRRLLKIIAN